MNTRIISASVDIETFKQFEKACKSDYRTVSQMIRILITEYLKRGKK